MEPPRCRCCLSNENLTDMKLNYFTTRGDSNTISYLDAYLSLLALPNEVRLQEVSGLGTSVMSICLECSSHLESAFIFRQLCSDVNDMLKTQNEKFVQQQHDEDRVNEPVGNLPAPKMATDDEEIPFAETNQDISQANEDFEDHNDASEESSSASNSITCGHCGSRFTTRTRLNKHIRSTHSYEANVPAVEDISYLDMLVRLDGEQKKTSARCKSCPRVFRTDSGLVRHIVRKHGAQPPVGFSVNGEKFPCPWCAKAFQYLSTLKLHMEKHSNETFRCPLCEANYKHSYNLKTHMLKIHKIANKD